MNTTITNQPIGIAVSKLEELSKLHETSITIDLGIDRIVQWMGVYSASALAIVLKFTENFDENLKCYPVHFPQNTNNELNIFGAVYCWDTPVKTPNDSLCSLNNKTLPQPVLRNPDRIKLIIKLIPYLLLLQFMQLFLDEIFNKLKNLSLAARNYERVYDKESSQLLGYTRYCRWEPPEPKYLERKADMTGKEEDESLNFITCSEFSTQSTYNTAKSSRREDRSTIVTVEPEVQYQEEDSASTSGKEENESSNLITSSQCSIQTINNTVTSSKSDLSRRHNRNTDNKSHDPKKGDDCDSKSVTAIQDGKNRKKSCLKTKGPRDWLTGHCFKDRHLFSLLCSENFASLHQLPYFFSVCKAKSASKDNKEPPFTPINKAILQEWCNEENFSGKRLVENYFGKNLFTAFLSFFMSIGYAFLFCFMTESFSNNSFICPISESNVCMLCVTRRIMDTAIVIFLECVLLIVIAIVIMRKWLCVTFIRPEDNSETFDAKFLEQLVDTSNSALEEAEILKADEKNKNEINKND